MPFSLFGPAGESAIMNGSYPIDTRRRNMKRTAIRRSGLLIMAGLAFAAAALAAGTKDLGNGFRDHGVAVPISNQRGAAATVDGQGRNVLLILLMDHRGGYSLLLLDAQSG